MQIKCSAEGCLSTIEVPNAGVKYLCRVHTGKDTKNDARFQEHQLDPELRRSGRSEGTNHVRRQGNDIDDFARTQEINLRVKGLI